MSVRFFDLTDGSLMKAFSPLEDVPRYSDWLGILLQRRAAYERDDPKGKRDPQTGERLRAIVPYDRWQEQAANVAEDGSVGIICLGCCKPVSLMDMSKIRIGGIVQFAEDTPLDEMHAGRRVTLLRKWRRMPVSKGGLGCSSCAELFLIEDGQVSRDNEQRTLYAEALKLMYTNKGDYAKAAKVKAASPRSAWLDVFSIEVKARQFTAIEALYL